MTSPKFWSMGRGAAAQTAHSWIRHCFDVTSYFQDMHMHMHYVAQAHSISEPRRASITMPVARQAPAAGGRWIADPDPATRSS